MSDDPSPFPPRIVAIVEQALPSFLLRQRWYPAKDAGPPTAALAALIPIPTLDIAAAVAIWRVTPPSQAPRHLFVPIAVVPAAEADEHHIIARLEDRSDCLVEAFSVDAFVHAWTDLLLRDIRPTLDERLQIGRTAQLGQASLQSGGAWTMRRGSAEQSNTSIRVGENAILKVIRNLQDGVNPELEIGRFLTEQAGFTATPAMLGWFELHDEAGSGVATLSIMQAFVANEGDGWSWLLGKLGAGSDEALAEGTAWLRRLGQRTAEMHWAFAREMENPNFRPEPATPQDRDEWAEAAQTMARRALDALAAAEDQFDPTACELRASVAAQRGKLMTQLEAAMIDVPILLRIRHHGDYHLGQVLVVRDDAVIVDFEGEPLRPIAERRAKHLGLRDVAGMLRSLAYAVETAGKDRPEPTRRRLSAWQAAASRAYLEAYMETAAGAPFCPADRTATERIVRFFMLEKALYEVLYELANRPDWIAIPLRGILALLDDKGPAAPISRSHRMPFGAEIQPDGRIRFRLWAPAHEHVHLVLNGSESLPMQSLADGWHELITEKACAGARYQFMVSDGLRVPDPASRYQPDDVHGPSEVIDPAAYPWRDGDWKGRPWEEGVLYEVHVGAFTQEGTFRAAIDKLDHLVSLGITAIEIMPIADFPGRRNWGYDGVLPYAPEASYGRPEDLKALIEAAHERGLMVLLDVVYNHFGPEGAYQHAIAPQLFTDRHKTPWGAAINTDGRDAAPVRAYFIHNALYWLEEYHFDGLRLDAVHAILDDSDKHLLEELAETVRATVRDRPIHLVLENEENEAKRLVRDADNAPRWYTAQWNDDVHHVLHVAASGEAKGYYADYKGDTEKLGRALAEGFAFQGEAMPYRGHPRGEPSAFLPPPAFVAFIQNHDQVGNRAFGDRLAAFASVKAVRAVAATYLLLPQVPMLFMGEEWAAAQPFPFFCDFSEELADAVRNGRRAEFARFPEFRDPAMRERIPDPTAETTFAAAKLRWDDITREPHAAWLAWYREILRVRREAIVPLLADLHEGGRYRVIGEGAVEIRWALGENKATLLLEGNFSDTQVKSFAASKGHILWQEGSVSADGAFDPWTVRWSIEPPTPNDALDALAERMGIEREFRDARATIVRASADTKRSLLAAMGIEASNEDAAKAALVALERAEWQRALPPALVVGSSGAVELTLPAVTAEVGWRIALEEGGEQSGKFSFAELRLVAERPLDGGPLQRRCWNLPEGLPFGYHQLSIDPGGASSTLIVTPQRCWLPDALSEGRRLWGIAAQLYLLRSATDMGIGDFGDLRKLIEIVAPHGADVIGLNPLHALFPDDPEHASPYSPASRLLLNILNIDVLALPECADEARKLIASDEFRGKIEACRAQSLVDYAGVAALKLGILERLFERRHAMEPARRQAFEDFRREGGEILERNCLFLALREHFSRHDAAEADWRRWPEAYRDPSSPAIVAFAAQHRSRLDFFVWLQWIADEQLGAAATAARQQGMTIGLYRDLGVGADRTGAETWANARAVVSGAQVGAPPDIHNPAGQSWGLPPFHPRALREEGYRSFIELLRANMRHAGGLRIDHAMGLQHLWWVPDGQKPTAGAYVRYPLEDLIGILALESHRQRCLVVGEDLGTVPEGFRERMAAANILSYRVLFFEQAADGNFLPPDRYPPLALAVIGSHDLPTLRGWWEGRDIALKERLGLYPEPGEAARQREARSRDKKALLRALRAAALLPEDGTEPEMPALARAAHAYLALTPSALTMAQIDDLTDEADPVNVPATSDEHPNWRRRLSMTLEEMAARPRFIDIMAIFRTERSHRNGGSADAAIDARGKR